MLNVGDKAPDFLGVDEQGNEQESYDLMLSEFKNLLATLKNKGIRVYEQGQPVYGEYYLDADGKLQYGELPAKAIAS